MKSQFLTSGREIGAKLVELAAAAEKWSLCSSRANALQGQSDLWRALEPYLSKLEYAIVGLELYRSEPWVLRALHDRGVLRVVASSDGSFHPHVYIFQLDHSLAAIVGSACFDMGTLENSCTSAMLTECDQESPFAYALKTFIDRCRVSARVLTHQEIDSYEHQRQEYAPLLERLQEVNLRRPEPLIDEESAPSLPLDIPERPIADDHSASNEGTKRDTPTRAQDGNPLDADAVEDAPAIQQAEIDADDVMYIFRQATRGTGQLEEAEVLRVVARRLGYQRLGRAIEQVLKKYLRIAIRRGIITRAEGALSVTRRGIDDYSRDELCQVLCSILRRGRQYDRDEIPTLVAKYLGFSRVTENVRTAVRSAITTTIRRGDLVRDRSGALYRARS